MVERLTPIDAEGLGELVRRTLPEGPPPSARLAQRERLVHHVADRATARGRWHWPVALAGALAAAAIVFAIVRPSPSPAIVPDQSELVASTSEWFAAPAGGVLAVDVGEGARLELVDGARGRMTRGQADDAIVVLETGRLQAEVDPAAHRRWTIEAGPYRVRVVGTIFSVAWDPTSGRLDVEVQRGKVEVVGPAGGSPIPVDAGHRLRASLPDATAVLGEIQAARADPAIVPALPRAEPSESTESAPRRAKPSAVAPKSWQALAREGDYAEAFATAEAAGFADLMRRSDRDALELLADTARLAKHPRQASEAYEAMRDRFAGTAAAARAAFQLGRLAADRGSDPRAAVGWFRTSLAEGPMGSFAPQARGRLVQALLDAGEREAARSAAQDYLERHPQGPYAKLARSLLPP